jgi:DNA-binding XRE family transcriptional regulator
MAVVEDERIPTGAMFRAARGLVGLGVSELADILNISRKTVFSIEEDISFRPDKRRADIVQAMREYFETKRGLLFLYDQNGLGEGVRYAGERQQMSPRRSKTRNSEK